MKPIPNIDEWLPRKHAHETLKDIFYKRCLHVESLMLTKAKQEKELNVDNFDSGFGIEEIIREELSKLLPDRYYVTNGNLNDRNGFTSGDHDVIIFNKMWFPILKSRKMHFPIEGSYAVGEIKQTLTIDTLDDAMKKLVTSKRLERPLTGRNRIIENRELHGCKHGFTNPLFTFIIATQLDEELSIDDVVMRFFEISKSLKRLELINCICILQKGTIMWNYKNEKNEIVPALFHNSDEDLNNPIFPCLVDVNDKVKTSFYSFMAYLNAHLYTTILGAEDLAVAYGQAFNNIKVPPLDEFSINP